VVERQGYSRPDAMNRAKEICGRNRNQAAGEGFRRGMWRGMSVKFQTGFVGCRVIAHIGAGDTTAKVTLDPAPSDAVPVTKSGKQKCPCGPAGWLPGAAFSGNGARQGAQDAD
jgi:hypothetical protein